MEITKTQMGVVNDYRIVRVPENQVKTTHDMDFTEGANHEAKPYVPDGEVWISDTVPEDRVPAVILHELVECWLMQLGAPYDRAHDLANGLELAVRQGDVAKWQQSVSAALQEGGEMPEPKAGESEGDFVARCVPIVIGEGLSQEQALGKCYGIYRNAQHKAEYAMGLGEIAEQFTMDELDSAGGPPLGHHLMAAAKKGKGEMLEVKTEDMATDTPEVRTGVEKSVRLGLAAVAGYVAKALRLNGMKLYRALVNQLLGK